MGLSIKQLAVHLRVSGDPAAEVMEPHLTVLVQLLRWAESVVDSRAAGAPDTARDEAVILLSGYLYDKPPAARGAGYGNAWENSSAANVLRPWTRRRGIVLESDAGAPGGAPGGVSELHIQALIRQSVADFLSERAVQGLIDQAIAAIPPADPGTALHEGVKLPAPARYMRVGWNQAPVISEAVFMRAGQHPIDGAVQGMTTGLTVPPAPPAISSDPTLYLALWIAGDASDATIIWQDGSGDVTGQYSMPMALSVGGVDGDYYVSTSRLPHSVTRRLSVRIPGDEILGRGDVAPWALTGSSILIPRERIES